MEDDPTKIVSQLARLELRLHNLLANRVVTILSERGDYRGVILWVGDGEVIMLRRDGVVEAFPYRLIRRIKAGGDEK